MAKKYKNMKDVAAAVEENGNLTTASLLELREALDFKRLGVGVLSTIERELDSEGLGYFPEWVLDGDQNTSPALVMRCASTRSAQQWATL